MPTSVASRRAVLWTLMPGRLRRFLVVTSSIGPLGCTARISYTAPAVPNPSGVSGTASNAACSLASGGSARCPTANTPRWRRMR